MAEYIDRDKVLSYSYCSTQLTVDNPLAEQIEVVDVEDIESIPAADVAEVKHSEWLPSPDGVNPIRCKECNTPAPFLCGDDDFGNEVIARYPFKYCPYCGAKMDGKDEL